MEELFGILWALGLIASGFFIVRPVKHWPPVRTRARAIGLFLAILFGIPLFSVVTGISSHDRSTEPAAQATGNATDHTKNESAEVTEAQYGKSWPFPGYASGVINCMASEQNGGPVVTIKLGDDTFGLNGSAMDAGYKDASDVDQTRNWWVGMDNAIQSFIENGLRQCDATLPTLEPIKNLPLSTKMTDAGYTPLHLASQSGNMALASLLIEQGANVNASISDNMFVSGATPLHLTRSPHLAALLLAHGAKLEAKDSIGRTPLMYAAERGDVAMCKFLLDKGANANAREDDGGTALQLVVQQHQGSDFRGDEKQSLAIADLLLKHHADIDGRNKLGDTALYLAVGSDFVGQVDFLLSHGANPNLQGENGETPLYFAAVFGKVETARSLLDHGADRNIKNSAGETPLHEAINGKRTTGVFGATILLLSSTATLPGQKQATSAGPSKWQYTQTVDKMRGTAAVEASVESDNTVDFDFPYDGGSTGSLVLQRLPNDVAILLSISKGQFLCDAREGGYVSVEFDNRPIETFPCDIPNDGRTNWLIINGNEKQFLSELRKAEKVTIEAEFYQEGIRQLTFETAGLNWQ